MSIHLINQEINRFLENKEPEVICLKGEWGVGKTYTWNKYLDEARSQKKVKLKKYSYVSLFGVDSIKELENSIVENTQIIKPNILLYPIRKIRMLLKYLRITVEEAPDIKYKNYVNLLYFFVRSFSKIRKQIICIDDLERKSEGITTNNIFGLISKLKEQQECKVILILNDKKLQTKDADDFKKYLEKVIDVEMKFEPTAAEAADIAIDKRTRFYKKFTEYCITLNIVNIRVIRKIERLIKILEELLKNHDDRILMSHLLSMILFCWACYEPGGAPSIDYLKKHNSFVPSDQKAETSVEVNWRQLINSGGYWYFDEFDSLLVTSVETGFFDQAAINKAAKEKDIKFKLQDEDNSFHQSWNKFHNSFEDNEKEVLDEMYKSFKKNVNSISPMNADGTICLLRKFKRSEQADELIKYYMSERKETKEFYDASHSPFLQLKDPLLCEVFKKKLSEYKDERTPREILLHIAKSSGWNIEDITKLTQVSSNEFYDLFKSLKGDELRAIVSQALKFKQYNPASDEMILISEHAEDALKKIAMESPFNRERVGVYGITIDSANEIALISSSDASTSI